MASNTGLQQRLKRYAVGQPLAQQRVDRLLYRAALELYVAVGGDGQDGHLVLVLGNVLHQRRRAYIGPLQVVDYHQQRHNAVTRSTNSRKLLKM